MKTWEKTKQTVPYICGILILMGMLYALYQMMETNNIAYRIYGLMLAFLSGNLFRITYQKKAPINVICDFALIMLFVAICLCTIMYFGI